MIDQALNWWETLSSEEKQKFAKKYRVETINTKKITSIYFHEKYMKQGTNDKIVARIKKLDEERNQ